MQNVRQLADKESEFNSYALLNKLQSEVQKTSEESEAIFVSAIFSLS